MQSIENIDKFRRWGKGLTPPHPPSLPPVDSMVRCVHLMGKTHMGTRSSSEKTFALLLLLFLFPSVFSISFSFRRGIRVQEPVII